MMSADRASGALFMIFGLAMVFYIVPTYVEPVEGGNLSPDTLPRAYSVALALFGAILVIRPGQHETQDVTYFVRAAIFTAILAASVYAMTWVGFLPVAPVLALILMLMVGERRPLWLLAGVVGVPATIWLLVTQLLDRTLP